MFEPSYQSDITTWLARVEERFDPKSGMVPHSAHTNAKESDIARGVSSVVMNRMLFEISPAVSSEHYQKTRARFATTRAGFFHGILEYPPGSPGRGDVDSGPLIFGLSLSATVVGIGGALLHDDPGFFEPVSSLFHAMGFPIFGRYGLGLLPVGEAFFVNALTTVSWVDPKAPDPVKYEPLVPVGWRWRWHLFSAFVVAMLLLPELLFRRLRKRDQALVDSL